MFVRFLGPAVASGSYTSHHIDGGYNWFNIYFLGPIFGFLLGLAMFKLIQKFCF